MSATSTALRVVIADDHHLVRAGFGRLLSDEPDIEVVAEAADGIEAVERTRRTRPDVVLLDIRMPRRDGLAAARMLLGDPRPPRIVILSTFDLDEYVLEALRIGASGFLLKDAPPEQLVDAVRTVARGDSLLAPSITRRLIEEVVRTRGSTRRPLPDSLSAREREVLVLVARGRSNAEIAEELFLGHATIKTHVGNVLAKLQVRDRVQAVIAAYEAGLVVPGEPEA